MSKSTARPSITSLPVAPAVDRHARERKYVILMVVRTACFIGMLIVPGWWKLLLGVFAIFLPYIAVMIANVSVQAAQGRTAAPLVPGDRLLETPRPARSLETAAPRARDEDAKRCSGWSPR